jgi:hypothetical protein
MKTYSVYRLEDEPRGRARNLATDEAFARVMAIAGSDYAFRKYGNVWRLDLVRKEPFSDLPFLHQDAEPCRELFPLFETMLEDPDEARFALMEAALRHGRDGVYAEVERNLAIVPTQKEAA